jgi:hypothetical protein
MTVRFAAPRTGRTLLPRNITRFRLPPARCLLDEFYFWLQLLQHCHLSISQMSLLLVKLSHKMLKRQPDSKYIRCRGILNIGSPCQATASADRGLHLYCSCNNMQIKETVRVVFCLELQVFNKFIRKLNPKTSHTNKLYILVQLNVCIICIAYESTFVIIMYEK